MEGRNVLSPVERQVMELAPGEALPLTRAQVEGLLVDPGYRSSLGHPPQARHFRRTLPDGGGLHLVIGEDGAAELHRDLHDPHAGPARFLMHLYTDAPGQTLSLLSAGWAVVRRLGGRGGRGRMPGAGEGPPGG